MKKLERTEMKGIIGGLEQNCSHRWFSGVTTCNVTYDNGYKCFGSYKYGGGVISLVCGFYN